MYNISQYITEKLRINKDSKNVYDEFDEFLKKLLDKWKMKYTIVKSTLPDKTKVIYITFNRKISDTKCDKLCAELNADIKWSKYSEDWVARCANYQDHRKFKFTLYEKSK